MYKPIYRARQGKVYLHLVSGLLIFTSTTGGHGTKGKMFRIHYVYDMCKPISMSFFPFIFARWKQMIIRQTMKLTHSEFDHSLIPRVLKNRNKSTNLIKLFLYGGHH